MRKAYLLPALVGLLVLTVLTLPPIAGANPGTDAVQPTACTSPNQSTPSGVVHTQQAFPGRVYLPVVLHPHRCRPNIPLLDPTNDVSAAHIDVTQVTSKLSGTTLEVTFYLRDLPAALAFHRPNVPANALEYAWELYIDVDDNRQTGASDGTEYSLSAMHWHFAGNSPVTGPIENNVQRNVWYFTPPSSWRTLSTAQMTVDYNAESFTLTADIPNITAGSRVFFETYDRNPDGERLYDYSTCAAEGEGGSLSESRRTAPDEDFSRQTHRWEVLSVTVE